MINDLAVLLIFLCFLAVRTDFVRRRSAYVASVACWLGAHLLAEYGYKPTTSGSYVYEGVMSGYLLYVFVFLAVLFMFVACLGPRRPRHAADAHTASEDADAGTEEPDISPSDRIRQIVNHK